MDKERQGSPLSLSSLFDKKEERRRQQTRPIAVLMTKD